MEVTRRNFIKFGSLGIVGSTVLVGTLPNMVQALTSNQKNNLLDPLNSGTDEKRLRFVVDLEKCIGCGTCVNACKLENDVPPEPEYNRTWVERYIITDDEEIYVDSPDAGKDGFLSDYINEKYRNLSIRKSFFVPKLCNQCENPPCVQVCPVGATYSTDEGVVLVDRKACIGCRYCIMACPYGARFLDPRFKVVDKCTWCYHRISKGELPACVEACPVQARTFGDINDRNSTVYQILKENSIGVLKENLGTEPMVYYVGLEKGVR